MPADHVIADVDSFQAAIAYAAPMRLLQTSSLPSASFRHIRKPALVTFVRRLMDCNAVPVESFVEKPDAATAESYVADGKHFWNSGMFLFKASTYLDTLKRLAPDMFTACEESMQKQSLDGLFIRPQSEAFLRCPSDSIDYAVMEKTDDAAMIPLDAGWSDVGSWSALQEVMPADEDGNSHQWRRCHACLRRIVHLGRESPGRCRRAQGRYRRRNQRLGARGEQASLARR